MYPLAATELRRQAALNHVQSLVLLLSLAGLLALVGGLLLGDLGVAVAIGLGLGALIANPSRNPRLGMRLAGALPLHPAEAPGLFRTATELARRAELPSVPELYYLPQRVGNAFAMGSERQSAIAISHGLLAGLTERELAGVLAHEISHIRNQDLRVMGLADLFSRTTGVLSLLGQVLLLFSLPLVLLGDLNINWPALLALIASPLLSLVAQMALSRTREFAADLGAVALTGDARGLARALARIEYAQRPWWQRLAFPGQTDGQPSALRTHPPTEERIERILALEHPPTASGWGH
ncbi:MAG: zinc metalloprotease HtpX [Gammaproteobacteria bacterium]